MSNYRNSIIGLILVCLLAPIKMSVLDVPLVWQSMVIMTMAAVLGVRNGLIVSLIYLALGALGLPVFAGYQSGFQKLTGPTAGFLWAFPLVAAYIAWQVRAGERSMFHFVVYFFRAHIIWIIPGFLVLYLKMAEADLLSTLVKMMPDILIKSLLGGILTYYITQKIPLSERDPEILD